jgi:protein-disulfide isomerase
MSQNNSSPMNSGNTFMDKYLTPIAVIVGCVLIALVVLLTRGGQVAQKAATNGQQAAPTANIANLKTDGEPFVGSASAPVTMAVFFDYQCPFCKQFDQSVLSQVYINYVETGKVKVVFKDFQFLGPNSLTAAEFARAMWQAYPSEYYAWFTAAFAAQGEESQTADPAYLAKIEKIAAALPGVDVTKVEALMTQNKTQYDAAITADRTEGAADGIQGTPSTLIGTTLTQGGQTYASVSAQLDAQLKGK